MNDCRWKAASWIVEKFPENYKEMTYMEPFLGCGSVFVHKEPSVEEILNDPDCRLMNVWRAVRDECDLFVSKVKRTKYSESTFKRRGSSNSSDYLSEAVNEFVLRHMSKNGMKKSFIPRENSENCSVCWKGLINSISSINDRIKSSFLLCRDAIEILNAFDGENTFVYCNSPEVEENSYSSEKHAEMGSILKKYRGKVLVIGPNSALYRRMYSEWNRKGVPSNPKESVWTNF
jgi:DNA adenine methylase